MYIWLVFSGPITCCLFTYHVNQICKQITYFEYTVLMGNVQRWKGFAFLEKGYVMQTVVDRVSTTP